MPPDSLDPSLHPSVSERLARLAPDQRAAATAPPGPTLCVAPAGSGKTTTLVARIAWLIASGAAHADEIAAITFNKRAADELRDRLAAALAPLGITDADGSGGEGGGHGAGPEGSGATGGGPGGVRVRTFHALGLEVLRDAGSVVEPPVDPMTILRRIAPEAGPAGAVGWRSLDTAISRLKLDLGVQATDVAADEEAGPIARAFVAYEAAITETGGLDFDDLVARALRTLETDTVLLERWRHRCAHLLVA